MVYRFHFVKTFGYDHETQVTLYEFSRTDHGPPEILVRSALLMAALGFEEV